MTCSSAVARAHVGRLASRASVADRRVASRAASRRSAACSPCVASAVPKVIFACPLVHLPTRTPLSSLLAPIDRSCVPPALTYPTYPTHHHSPGIEGPRRRQHRRRRPARRRQTPRGWLRRPRDVAQSRIRANALRRQRRSRAVHRGPTRRRRAHRVGDMRRHRRRGVVHGHHRVPERQVEGWQRTGKHRFRRNIKPRERRQSAIPVLQGALPEYSLT